MPLMLDLIETYENFAGNEPEGMSPIAPIGHQYGSKKTVIDITISRDGTYRDATINAKFDEEKTLLAVTEESASRSSSEAANMPHALNDKLMYMSGKYFKDKNDNRSYYAYLDQLSKWCESDHACDEIKIILKYLQHHDLVDDLMAHQKFTKTNKNGKIDLDKFRDYTVRWSVQQEHEESEPRTWKNKKVIQSWSLYYRELHTRATKGLDGITGQIVDLEILHPKAISVYGNSKLISIATKENSTLNFMGERFNNAEQTLQIGYETSQKIHNALSWLIDTQGIPISENSLPYGQTDKKPKYIVCWSPEKRSEEESSLLSILLGREIRNDTNRYCNYKDVLKRIMMGMDESIPSQHVALLMIDRSGDGRFSPVMYRSYTTDEYFEKLKSWYENCSWYTYSYSLDGYVLKNPSLFDIAKCAYGIERLSEKDMPFLNVKDSVFKDTVNTLLSIVLDGRSVPDSLIRRLVSQASAPERFSGNESHKWKNWNEIIFTACAMIHYRNVVGEKEKGEKNLMLDKENIDRSYLFGRLLAVADKIENTALNKKFSTSGEKTDHRDTNAMRMWSAYAAHPYTCYANLRKCIEPYLSSLPYGSRKFYEDETQEIIVKLDVTDKGLNHPLNPDYLLGFYQERAELNQYSKSTAEERNSKEDT